MDLSLRDVASLLGLLAFGALLYRLVETWTRTVVLVHALGILLALSLLISAMGSYSLDRVGAPPSEFQIGPFDIPTTEVTIGPWSLPVLWLTIAHRVVCLIIAVFWAHWLERRHSLLKREPKTV